MNARRIYDTPHAVAGAITLQPGESMEKEVTPHGRLIFLFWKRPVRRELAEEGDLRIGHAWKEPGKDPLLVDQREKQGLPRVPGRKLHRPTEGIAVL